MDSRAKFPIKKYPFSDELCLFMDKNPKFFNSLKLANSKRFEFIPLIFTSHTPKLHPKSKDEVIGMWYLDKDKKKCKEHNIVCLFKQDFVVNIGYKNKEFISYSTNNNKGKYIKPIKVFFRLYGENGKYYHKGNQWQHHYRNVKDLPNESRLKSFANKLIAKI